MVDSSSSSLGSFRQMTRDKLYIGGHAKPPIKQEVVVHFDKDNHLVVKVKPDNMRNICFLPFLEMADSKETKGNDQATFTQELNWIDNDI